MQLFNQNGIDSNEYLDKIVNDVGGLLMLEEMPISEVLEQANVSTKCLEASYEEHVGDENSIHA